MSKKRTYEEDNENLITTAIENAGAALENAASSSATEYIQKNVEYRASAGLKETIIREELSSCCKWCHDLAGTYEYGKEPSNVYARHDNCKCIVLFKSAKGKYQDVWSKKKYDIRNDAVQERIKSIENILNKEYNKQTKSYQLKDWHIGKSIGAAARNYNILLPDGRNAKFAEGTSITKVKVFAGKGTENKIREEKALIEKYGGKEGEWMKVRAEAIIRDEGENKKAEIHYYQLKNDKYKIKIKGWR